MYKWNSTQDTTGNWVENKKMVAKLVPSTDIKGLAKQDVVVGPDEAAVLIRDGKIEDVVNQTRLKNVAGGLGSLLGNWSSKLTGGGESAALLFVNTNPIDLKVQVTGTTKDYVDIAGECTLRFQINPQDAAKLISMITSKTSSKQTGMIFKKTVTEEKTFLTEEDVLGRLRSEMNVKVFSPHISAHTSDEFRGNMQLTKDMETAVLTQMQKTFSIFGLSALDMFVDWQGTEFDAVMKERRRMQLQDTLRESQHQQRINEASREWELKRTSVAGEENLSTQRTKAQIERDRIAHENEVLKAKDRIALEREEDDSDMETLSKLTDIKAKMNEQKIKGYQETEIKRRSIELDVDKERIRGDVERAKYNVDTIERAQDRERAFHRGQMEDVANLNRSLKQNVPNTIVTGAGTPSTVVGVNANQGANAGGSQFDGACGECGEPMKSKWKVCPNCGANKQ